MDTQKHPSSYKCVYKTRGEKMLEDIFTERADLMLIYIQHMPDC